MKRKPAPVASADAEPSMEVTIALIRETINSYLGEKLRAGTYYTGKDRGIERAVLWSFGTETPKSASSTSMAYTLTITARHGAFGEIDRVKHRSWWSTRWITREEVTNALFNALSFSGSPYQFDGKVWSKRVEVM